jgi:hypothetical protein
MLSRMSLPTAPALVDAAKAALGCKTDMQLAVALRTRYGLNTHQSDVTRWKKGDPNPSYRSALALLHAAGWLTLDVPLSPDEVLPAALEAEQQAERLTGQQQPARDKRRSARGSK